jgi:hypothetical protein
VRPDSQLELALATTPVTGTSRPDGSIQPLTDHQLNYVLISRKQTCYPVGPAGSSLAAEPCTVIQLIDANTGQLGFGSSGPY